MQIGHAARRGALLLLAAAAPCARSAFAPAASLRTSCGPLHRPCATVPPALGLLRSQARPQGGDVQMALGFGDAALLAPQWWPAFRERLRPGAAAATLRVLLRRLGFMQRAAALVRLAVVGLVVPLLLTTSSIAGTAVADAPTQSVATASSAAPAATAARMADAATASPSWVRVRHRLEREAAPEQPARRCDGRATAPRLPQLASAAPTEGQEVRRGLAAVKHTIDEVRGHVSATERDSMVLLLASALVTPLMGAIGLSPVLGFLFAGILLGPSGLALISDVGSTTKCARQHRVYNRMLCIAASCRHCMAADIALQHHTYPRGQPNPLTARTLTCLFQARRVWGRLLPF